MVHTVRTTYCSVRATQSKKIREAFLSTTDQGKGAITFILFVAPSFFCFLISKIQRWGISFSCSTARDASHKTMSHLFPSFSPFLCQGQIKLFLLSCREIERRGEKGKSEFCASLNPPDIFWSPSRTTYDRNYLLAILKRKICAVSFI